MATVTFKGQLKGVVHNAEKKSTSYVFMERGGSEIRLAGKDVILPPGVPELVPLMVVAEVKASVMNGLNYLLITSIKAEKIASLD